MNRLQQLKRARIDLIHKWINQAGKLPEFIGNRQREIAYNRACLHYYRGEWETLAPKLELVRWYELEEEERPDPYVAAFARILKQEARRNVAK